MRGGGARSGGSPALGGGTDAASGEGRLGAAYDGIARTARVIKIISVYLARLLAEISSIADIAALDVRTFASPIPWPPRCTRDTSERAEPPPIEAIRDRI